jgi:hypothetical protein
MRSFSGSLVDTIPGFHDTPLRLQAWQSALAVCTSPHRLETAQPYVAFVQQRASDAGLLVEAMRSGRIPTSVSHNDAKIGNVLFDQRDGSFICIIDFDTTMQGTPLYVETKLPPAFFCNISLRYDFGDLCRSAVPCCEEDEADLRKIELRMDFFRALARGFIQGCGNLLTRAESEMMWTAAWVITFEQGVRFFTDYLNGDVYYAQRRPNHNW